VARTERARVEIDSALEFLQQFDTRRAISTKLRRFAAWSISCSLEAMGNVEVVQGLAICRAAKLAARGLKREVKEMGGINGCAKVLTALDPPSPEETHRS
jgi:hypothetical protein